MSDVGFRVQSQKWRQAIQGLDITRNPKSDIRNPLFYTAPSPGLLRTLVFMVPSVETTYISSSVVREVAQHHGILKGLVHPAVAKALAKKFESGPVRGKR